jgi:multiple sugar transport system ATP-binding protein
VNAFGFDIGRVEYLGADRLVYGTLAPPWPASRVIARLPVGSDLTLTPGRRQRFFVRERDLRRFDRASGRRVP